MSLFANHFRSHVTPRLRGMAERQAFLVAADAISFAEAVEAVLREAFSRGAGYLPSAIFDELLDWVYATVSQEIEKAEAACAEMDGESERRRQADPVAYYTDLNAQCSQPMEWVFAAISPEYRAHLLAVKRAQ